MPLSPDVLHSVRALDSGAQVEFVVSLGGCAPAAQLWTARTHALRGRGPCLTVRAPAALGGRHVVTFGSRGFALNPRVAGARWLCDLVWRVAAAVAPFLLVGARVSPARAHLRELCYMLIVYQGAGRSERRAGARPALPARDFL